MPPLTPKQCEDVAIEALRKNKRSGSFPPFKDVAASNGHVRLGQTAVSSDAYAMSQLGKAEKQRQDRLLRATQQNLALGLGRGMSAGMPAGMPAGRGRGNPAKPAAAGSAKRAGLQVIINTKLSKDKII